MSGHSLFIGQWHLTDGVRLKRYITYALCSGSAGDSVVAVKPVKRERCNVNLSQCFLIVTIFSIQGTEYFCFVSQFVFKSCCFTVLQLPAVQLHVEDIHFMQD